MNDEQSQLMAILDYQKDQMDIQVKRTTLRLKTRVGHGEKARHKLILPVLAAEILQRENYTIDFNPKSEETKQEGYKYIWQYLAFRNPIEKDMQIVRHPSNCDRFRSVLSKDWKTIRKAFVAFRRHIDVDWKRYPLLMVPRYPGNKSIEVITFDPHFQVNETQTAAQVYLAGTQKRFKETTRSLLEKLSVIGGGEMVREAKVFIEKFIQDEVINGCRQPMLTFDDSNK